MLDNLFKITCQDALNYTCFTTFKHNTNKSVLQIRLFYFLIFEVCVSTSAFSYRLIWISVLQC